MDSKKIVEIDDVIYQFWTGNNQLTPNRLQGLLTTLINVDAKVKFISSRNLEQYIVKEYPLHPAYQYLSSVHKSDYLRSYFMHFYGGGYADIKKFSAQNNWKQCFELINDNKDIWIIGAKEINGGSPIQKFNSPEYLNKVLVNGWFICRPQTEFTAEWYRRVQNVLDKRINDLKEHPSTDPFGGQHYPIRWAEIQGEIFHQLIVDMYDSNKIKNCLQSGVTSLIESNYR